MNNNTYNDNLLKQLVEVVNKSTAVERIISKEEAEYQKKIMSQVLIKLFNNLEEKSNIDK